MYISVTTNINSPLLSNTFQNNSYGFVTKSRILYNNQGFITLAASGAAKPTLTNNSFITHTVYPIALLGNGWPSYSGNTFSGSFYPAIALGGYHGGSGGLWPIVSGDNGQPFPYVVDSDVRLEADATFQPGARS